jgi:hypothetical protein
MELTAFVQTDINCSEFAAQIFFDTLNPAHF